MTGMSRVSVSQCLDQRSIPNCSRISGNESTVAAWAKKCVGASGMNKELMLAAGAG